MHISLQLIKTPVVHLCNECIDYLSNIKEANESRREKFNDNLNTLSSISKLINNDEIVDLISSMQTVLAKKTILDQHIEHIASSFVYITLFFESSYGERNLYLDGIKKSNNNIKSLFESKQLNVRLSTETADYCDQYNHALSEKERSYLVLEGQKAFNNWFLSWLQLDFKKDALEKLRSIIGKLSTIVPHPRVSAFLLNAEKLLSSNIDLSKKNRAIIISFLSEIGTIINYCTEESVAVANENLSDIIFNNPILLTEKLDSLNQGGIEFNVRDRACISDIVMEMSQSIKMLSFLLDQYSRMDDKDDGKTHLLTKIKHNTAQVKSTLKLVSLPELNTIEEIVEKFSLLILKNNKLIDGKVLEELASFEGQISKLLEELGVNALIKELFEGVEDYAALEAALLSSKDGLDHELKNLALIYQLNDVDKIPSAASNLNKIAKGLTFVGASRAGSVINICSGWLSGVSSFKGNPDVKILFDSLTGIWFYLGQLLEGDLSHHFFLDKASKLSVPLEGHEYSNAEEVDIIDDESDIQYCICTSELDALIENSVYDSPHFLAEVIDCVDKVSGYLLDSIGSIPVEIKSLKNTLRLMVLIDNKNYQPLNEIIKMLAQDLSIQGFQSSDNLSNEIVKLKEEVISYFYKNPNNQNDNQVSENNDKEFDPLNDDKFKLIFIGEFQDLLFDMSRGLLSKSKNLYPILHTLKGISASAKISNVNELIIELMSLNDWAINNNCYRFVDYIKYFSDSIAVLAYTVDPSKTLAEIACIDLNREFKKIKNIKCGEIVLDTTLKGSDAEINGSGSAANTISNPKQKQQAITDSSLQFLPEDIIEADIDALKNKEYKEAVAPIAQDYTDKNTSIDNKIVKPSDEALEDKEAHKISPIEDSKNTLNIDILDFFIEEMDECVVEIENAIEILKAKDDFDDNFIVNIKRHMHTLKGGANLAGAAKLGAFYHEMETLFDKCKTRAQLIQVPAIVWESLLKTIHESKISLASGNQFYPDERLIDWLIAGDYSLEPEIADINNTKARAHKDNASDVEASKSHKNIAENVSLFSARAKLQYLDAQRLSKLQNKSPLIKVRQDTIDTVIASSSMLRSQQSRMRDAYLSGMNVMFSIGKSMDRLKVELGARNIHADGSVSDIIRDISKSFKHLDEYFTRYRNYLNLQELVVKDLQRKAISSRLIPFKSAEKGFNKVVLDSAKALDKTVNLLITGADSMVDKVILDKVSDPILHILRNAVDHGIESEAERKKINKSKSGKISLNVQLNNNVLVISIQDDGRGLSKEKILNKAQRLGLYPAGQKISDSDAYQYITHSGFSTAENLTSISGRGVGMDIVKSTIESLSGSLMIDSKKGKGTRFIIKIPTNVGTQKIKTFKINSSNYAVLANDLSHSAEQSGKYLKGLFKKYDKPYIIFKDKQYTLIPSTALINTHADMILVDRNKYSLIFVEENDKNYALITDDLSVEAYEVVIRSAPKIITNSGGIRGYAEITDNNACLILDIKKLCKHYLDSVYSKTNVGITSLQKEKDSRPTVMVIDDSVLYRKYIASLLTKNGISPILSPDAFSALDYLQKTQKRPVAIIVDYDMPKMNGEEFVNKKQNTNNIKNIPVLMVTANSEYKAIALRISCPVLRKSKALGGELLSELSKVRTS